MALDGAKAARQAFSPSACALLGIDHAHHKAYADQRRQQRRRGWRSSPTPNSSIKRWPGAFKRGPLGGGTPNCLQIASDHDRSPQTRRTTSGICLGYSHSPLRDEQQPQPAEGRSFTAGPFTGLPRRSQRATGPGTTTAFPFDSPPFAVSSVSPARQRLAHDGASRIPAHRRRREALR